MEPIVLATWGLVAATFVLVVVTWLQGQRQERASKTQADRENAQLASLKEQSAALAETARASQSMADEMRQARIASNPLQVRIELDGPGRPGVFAAKLQALGYVPVIVHRVELFVGQGPRLSTEPVAAIQYGNAYLAGSNNSVPIDLSFTEGPSYPTDGDLLVARVTGRRQVAKSSPASSSTAFSRDRSRIYPCDSR